MKKGFYISKAVGILAVVVGAAALATIIALSVVYSQEKAKNNNQAVLPTDGGTTSKPTTTAATTSAPSNKPWDQYRLPKTLEPIHYNVMLWPRLRKDETTGLYIFTGKTSSSTSLSSQRTLTDLD